MFTTNFTTKKYRKQENSIGRVGNTNLVNVSVCNSIVLNYGMIWNSGEWWYGGGRGIRTLGTLSRTAH